MTSEFQTESPTPSDSGFLGWLTGAKKEEQLRVLLTFLALFCLLVSYYIVKPLRNSKFLSEFDASRLPFVYAGVAVLSFSLTKVFSQLAVRIEKYRLVIGAYAVIVVFKLAFVPWLKYGGKPAVVAFYFFASVYFLLAVATLWACINDMFTVEQGKRVFGFVALGSTIGGIAGSRLGDRLAGSALGPYALFIAIAFLVVALGFVLLAAKVSPKPAAKLAPASRLPDSRPQDPSKSGFLFELKALAERPFLRSIALSVLLLAVATTAVEFVSQAAISRGLAEEQHAAYFGELKTVDFTTVFELKSRSPEEREKILAGLAFQNGLESSELITRYENYRQVLETEMTRFFAQTYAYQGVAGVLSLLVVARLLFPYVGMRYCFSLLPCAGILSLLLFCFEVDLFVVQVVLVVMGALNYSLNNAAKEILYTSTDEETLFRFKPMIEGPCMRAGDVLSSILKIATGAVAASYALSEMQSLRFYVFVTCGVLSVWLWATWSAGSWFDSRKDE